MLWAAAADHCGGRLFDEVLTPPVPVVESSGPLERGALWVSRPVAALRKLVSNASSRLCVDHGRPVKVEAVLKICVQKWLITGEISTPRTAWPVPGGDLNDQGSTACEPQAGAGPSGRPD